MAAIRSPEYGAYHWPERMGVRMGVLSGARRAIAGAKTKSANWIAVAAALLLALFAVPAAYAQAAPGQDPNISASLVAESAAKPGEKIFVAIHFQPVSEEWHGYWKNPGDAGYGIELDWQLPDGWSAGEPLYPVPKKLLISGLMNHIYEGGYAVLVPLQVPQNAMRGIAPIKLAAQWLACTDKICVPEGGTLQLDLPVGDGTFGDARFAQWRAAIPPMLDRKASFEFSSQAIRIAVPLPDSAPLNDPHIYIAAPDLVQYAAVQTFGRADNLLVAEIPLARGMAPIDSFEAILAFQEGEGIRFTAAAGQVPDTELRPMKPIGGTPPLFPLLFAALIGGLILNIMPCVFPILSLKAMSLAKAGVDEGTARMDGIAYTAGAVLACVALGGLMLALRAAGEQVGWAFQLQEPWVVVVLLVLTAMITANFAGLFELPQLGLFGDQPTGAFGTGLLAAFVATPCTGPFMAAALGAALVLPPFEALLLFAALGLGLASPFLAIGLFPALRRRLPKPGPWMGRFRKAMAIPMGLTFLALIWLTMRIGGSDFAAVAMVMVGGILIGLAVVGRLQSHGKMAWPALGLVAAPFVVFAAAVLPAAYTNEQDRAEASLLNPIEFSEAALQQARNTGQPVFVWFTADWCVTCKVNEQVAIEREETKRAFEKVGVITLRADWTQRDEEIANYLAAQGVGGIPHYVWFAPGAQPEVLPQLLSPAMLTSRARQVSPPADGNAAADARDAGLD